MSKNITDALSKLDPANDNHWTQDGLPRLDTIKILAGDPSLTREAVTAAAPDFTRLTAQAAAGAAQAGAGTTPAAPADGGQQGAAQAAPPADPPVPPAPPVTEPEVTLTAPPAAEESSESDILKKQLEEAQLNLSDRADALRAAQQALKDAQDEVSVIEEKLLKISKTSENPSTEYLKRQQKVLAERGARKALIKDSGLDLKQLAKDLKSPLESAMERKNSRGGQRPVRS